MGSFVLCSSLMYNYMYMKNSLQKGSATLIVIIIILLGIVGWLYFKKQPAQSLEATPVTEVSNATTTAAPVLQKQSSLTLTDQDVLGATYTISANFGGKKTAPQKVRLPYIPNGKADPKNEERLYIAEDGSVVRETDGGAEMFYISSYKFTDSTHLEAIVYVTGKYGGTGSDNRTFTVTKLGGQVVTKELLRF